MRYAGDVLAVVSQRWNGDWYWGDRDRKTRNIRIYEGRKFVVSPKAAEGTYTVEIDGESVECYAQNGDLVELRNRVEIISVPAWKGLVFAESRKKVFPMQK